MKRYLKYWYMLTINSFSSQLISRFGGLLFIIGKTLRFVSFIVFLSLIVGKTQSIAGYNLYQASFFFLTYNLIDTISQLLFREVYRFRQLVVSGNLDLVLVKPISPLFRVLLGGTDPFDLIMLVPFAGGAVLIGANLHPTWTEILTYIVLVVSGLAISCAFHIFVLGLGVLTTEIDHAIMIYRDIVSTGRVPVDIYQEPLRSFLLFVLPVGIMMTVPAKALFGLLSPLAIITSIGFSGLFLYLSLRFWRYALARYTSASS